jgi:hypothetical protein
MTARDDRLRELLRETPVPEEHEAAERGRRVVLAAYGGRTPGRPRSRRGRTLALALAASLVLVGLLLSPAGARVRDWVADVVEDDGPPAAPALTEVPSGGRLLVESEAGPWLVRADGSRRLLGDYDDATWSPHGLYVGVSGGRQLSAVDPRGEVRWSLSRPQTIHDPAWSSGEGFRIAYLAGAQLRLVAGDGTGDELLAPRAAPVTPAWRPGRGNVLAYFAADRRARVIDVDSGRLIFVTAPLPAPVALDWSADGRRLLAAGGALVRVTSGSGSPLGAFSGGQSIAAAAFEPGSHRIAVLTREGSRNGPRSAALLISDAREPRPVPLFTAPGAFTALAWSPQGDRLLVAWRDADQWLFIKPDGGGRVEAIGEISSQFAPGGGEPSFPRVIGWCCPP